MSRYRNLEFFNGSHANFNESFLVNNSSGPLQHLVGIYNKVELWSAIVLLVLSPITVLANGLFLFALYRDSLRCFRKTPTTAFVAGLSLADFITGLLVEPTFACYFILHYHKPHSRAFEIAKVLYTIAGTISTIAISASFVTVLAMSLSQYIAIQCPHKYKNIVTTKRAVRLQVLSGLYFLGFSLLQYTGISREEFLLLDVILHPTLISCCLIIVHILMRRAFKLHVEKPAKYRKEILGFKQTLSEAENQSETKLSPAMIMRNIRNVAHSLSTSLPASPLSIRSFGKTYQKPSPRRSYLDKVRINDIPRNSSTIRDDGKIYDAVSGVNDKETATCTENEDEAQDIQSLRVELSSMPTTRRNSEVEQLPMLDRTGLTASFISQGNDADDDESTVLRPFPHSGSGKRKKAPIEKQFALMSFYLSAILLVSSISHIIVFYVFLLRKPKNFQENVYIHIALRITDLMLFIKVSLDAFIFAWRLPAFRTFLMLTISCRRIELEN